MIQRQHQTVLRYLRKELICLKEHIFQAWLSITAQMISRISLALTLLAEQAKENLTHGAVRSSHVWQEAHGLIGVLLICEAFVVGSVDANCLPGRWIKNRFDLNIIICWDTDVSYTQIPSPTYLRPFPVNTKQELRLGRNYLAEEIFKSAKLSHGHCHLTHVICYVTRWSCGPKRSRSQSFCQGLLQCFHSLWKCILSLLGGLL